MTKSYNFLLFFAKKFIFTTEKFNEKKYEIAMILKVITIPYSTQTIKIYI